MGAESDNAGVILLPQSFSEKLGDLQQQHDDASRPTAESKQNALCDPTRSDTGNRRTYLMVDLKDQISDSQGPGIDSPSSVQLHATSRICGNINRAEHN